jgi:hypothetical protein
VLELSIPAGFQRCLNGLLSGPVLKPTAVDNATVAATCCAVRRQPRHRPGLGLALEQRVAGRAGAADGRATAVNPGDTGGARTSS